MGIVCPKCYRLFTRELEAEKIIDQSEGKEKKLPKVYGGHAFVDGPSGHIIDLTYEKRYRCRHCGHEWTEIKTKEGKIREK